MFPRRRLLRSRILWLLSGLGECFFSSSPYPFFPLPLPLLSFPSFPPSNLALFSSSSFFYLTNLGTYPPFRRYGIRVNSLSPGYMDTLLNEGPGLQEARDIWASRNPMGRMGVVGELDGVVVLLCSRAGSYINGADFVVDGGATVF
jgi:hypothetical protein